MQIQRIAIVLIGLHWLAACSGGSNEPAAPVEPQKPSATERALGDLQRKYEELTGDNDPVEWASEDIENIGDWEYKVVDLSATPILEWEAALNELGNERWEVIWIDSAGADRVAILKRPSVSILSKVPLSQLGRLLMGMGGGDAEQ